ncbi:hypothetical protein DB41_GB00050 [Neochlamydia sp. TUME1]|uniref:F-box/LRR-repeat protein n=1 Tax=Neochlamydia sp. TUME1 TaxID=1478174 RepID=UPI000583C7A2|nr:leucine-rich repeat domain-containing protein [Neochlamydia sp. TUME1]KIC76470.1 hypothetical protein DB41_GB00050 [Neochlamydia sp. TUME1]
MNPNSSISIEHLPNEVLSSILEYCPTPALLRVCTRWRHLLATEVMPSLYKQIGKMHVPQGNVSEQAFILDRIYKLESGLPEIAKVNAIFKQIFTLASSLSPLELEFKWKTEEKRYLTLANYSSYLVNINRLLIWKEIPGGKEYLDQEEIKYLPLAKKGELFRDWIERHGKVITSLNLTEIGLTFLPAEIGQLSQLEVLHLNDSQLSSLPAEIGQLSLLQYLYLNNNPLTSLPAEIGQLSQLQYLFIQKNQLTTLPAEIGQLSQLQRLSLSNNRLTTLPAELEQLPEHLDINLKENPLESIPDEIKQRFRL